MAFSFGESNEYVELRLWQGEKGGNICLGHVTIYIIL